MERPLIRMAAALPLLFLGACAAGTTARAGAPSIPASSPPASAAQRSPHEATIDSLMAAYDHDQSPGGIIGVASLYRISSLGSGGSAVAMQMGGMPVPEDTADPQLRRLRNVVEEMSIASGVPVPAVFVMEQEPAINAFAAGYSPSDAAVAVTRGTLDKLNRDELQGVIAHEYSHILNGDMRLNIRLMGVLFGILALGLIGRKILMFGGRSRERGAAAILVAALVAILIGYIGIFFGRMIKAGVSRSREVLADASAVQFTRQTQGIAGALKKIAGVQEGSRFEQRADHLVGHSLGGAIASSLLACAGLM